MFKGYNNSITWELNKNCNQHWDGSGYQIVYKKSNKENSMNNSVEQYILKEICELKTGDTFRFRSSQDGKEKVFRVVDKEDYKKVFGNFFPSQGNNTLAYCESENRFTHFGPCDKVSVQRQLISIQNLKPGTDFEYEGRKYYFNSYDFKYVYCIRLDKKENNHRNKVFDLNTMVYPLD